MARVVPSAWGGHAFTIALGVIGWLIVLALPAVAGAPAESPPPTLPVALFVIVILAARGLAFRLPGVRADGEHGVVASDSTVLSLDSAYYVAAALCVGAVEAGRLVAVALTVDAMVRL